MKAVTLIRLLLPLLALLPSMPVPAAIPDPSAIDALMQRYQGDGPGAALLVVRDGTPVVAKGYGLAELESATPVTPLTNFRLASVSKQFTAAAILLLAEDGKLSLDDPLRRWLPSLPPATDGIRLHHLLSHTSGLVDYEDVMEQTQEWQLRDADVLSLVQGVDRLYFAPGSGYRYSNTGYCLLALVVEQASGLRFADFLRRRIFQPLGMNGSVAREDGGLPLTHRAYGYSLVDGHWQRTDQSNTSATLGDGGIYASIEDLAKWDAALYDERLLKASSLRRAFTPATTTDEPDVPHYGYGWRINGELLWHSGESIGFRNVILRYPRQRLTVVLLSNRNDPEPYATARSIADLFLPR